MKQLILPLIMIFTLIEVNKINAQSDFNPDAYKAFLEINKSTTASELIGQNPPKTVYYESRQYPTDVDQIPWFDSINIIYDLTDQEKELLAHNHFMVSDRLRDKSWLSSLIRIYNNDLPLFISSDFILYTLHNSYDNLLLTLEWQLLEPNLIVVLESMYNQYSSLYDKYKGDSRLSESLEDVDLYISVAVSLLLNSDRKPQKHDHIKYDEVMTAIDAEQMTYMTLFTEERDRKLDFSQLKPRGHYTKTIYTATGEKTLENYFRAMMWLGRTDFLLTAPPENPWEKEWTREELTRMQVSAILLNELLYSSGKKDLLDLHETVITFLVGPDDNLTPNELHQLSENLLSSVTDLFNIYNYNAFADTLNSSDDYGQKIMSNFFLVDPMSSDPGKLPVSFKLLGQKFILDSYITAEVVFDRIIWEGQKVFRGLPDPLDVMSVLGNENAMALMEDEMNTYKYAYKISSLKHLVDEYDDDFWVQSLYNTWLSAIKKLNPVESSKGLPYFMNTTAWHLEKLNTQLSSWAALRHDNLLYAKQSYTGGTSCSYPYTYIEPYPEFYGTLAVFANKAAEFFKLNFDAVSLKCYDQVVEYYTDYADIMDKFEIISRKELSGEAFSESEITFLKTMINSYMISGPSVSGWYNDLFFDRLHAYDKDYIVADIHTQPTDEDGAVVGHVFHVGNGNINTGVFLAPNPVNPSQLMAFAGPVSSFHYEVTNDFYRYTDDEWMNKFSQDKIPPARPDWVNGYMANNQGNIVSSGRRLKGTEFGGTSGVSPGLVMKDIDYLLAFPNPATDIIHLRFILNKKNDITVKVYNSNGTLVKDLYNGTLSPAEHDIPVDISEFKEGFYMIRMQVGEQILTRKVIIN